MERIVEPDNLRLAWIKTIRGKRDCKSVLVFRKNLEQNLEEIGKSLSTVTRNWGPYSTFRIFDPKERDITVAPIADRVAYHAIMNICEEFFDSRLIYDTYACRRGKGQVAALRRAKDFSAKHKWYLKLDIRHYFASIDHEILERLLWRLFKDTLLMKNFSNLIGSYETETGKGIPIGSLTSQYFANYYLGSLDRFVKEQLRCREYVRYMDDFVLWSNSREELRGWKRKLSMFLREELQLQLKVPALNRTEFGISFLGFRVFPGILRLSHRGRYRFRRKCRKYMGYYRMGKWTEETLAEHLCPLFSFVEQAESIEFRRHVCEEEGICP